MATIRGHMGEFRILEDGQVVDIVHITKVDINQDSSMMRSNFVGNGVPMGDQSQDGWSGSLDMEVLNDKADLFIDALIAGNLAGIGVKDYAFVSTENYPDGSSASYLYTDCQFKYSRSNGGQTEKITKRLEFQASFRQRI